MSDKVQIDGDELIEKALRNISSDRAKADALLVDITVHMKEKNRTEESGLIAAKFLETLQRSNEQNVKIIGILEKRRTKSSNDHFKGFDSEDIEDIYREIEDKGEG